MLEFKRQSKIEGIKCGYYFKGEFLSRYKTEVLQILRDRIEKAGSKVGDKSQTDFEKGMQILKDEYEVFHEEYLKVKEKTERTKNIKQPYFKYINKRVIARSLITWQGRLETKERQRAEIIEKFDNSIQTIKTKIEELEGRMKSKDINVGELL